MVKKIVFSFLLTTLVSAVLCIAWIAGACYNFMLPIGLPFAAWAFYVYDVIREHHRHNHFDDLAPKTRP